MSTEVPDDSDDATLIAEEERILARVQARAALGDQHRGPRMVGSDIDQQLIDLRDQISEARAEDLAPLVEQMTRLAALRSRLGGSRTLPIDEKSPYFAHMVLAENGTSRDVLVGKRGFIDRTHNIQIVDWRNAPISQIYYRYEQGDDYDEEIAGRSMEGLVEIRRNVSIASGRLRRIGAPQGTYVRDARNVWHRAVGQAAPVLQGGSGKAARAGRVPEEPRAARGGRKRRRRGGGGRGRDRDRGTLGVHHGPIHQADKHLPEIAALIDKEQFELITHPQGGLVVIQGGAGSGKTTVALHRIAYLNFADGRRFKPRSILFVVPSDALMRYVADVLPALGVRGVPVLTYRGWARTTRVRMLEGTKARYNGDTPDSVSRLKKHPALLAILDRYAARQGQRMKSELAERMRGAEARDRVLSWWDESGGALVPALRTLRQRVKEASDLPTPTRLAADGLLKRHIARADDILADWEELFTDRALLREGFAADQARDGEIDKLVSWCMAQQPDDTDEVDEVTTADGQRYTGDDKSGRYDHEDDPVLLRLIQIKRGRLVNRQGHEVVYEHVAIDEAQDRSAIEVKVLIEATAKAGGDARQRSVTIAGDTAQRLVFDNHFSGWEDLLGSIGHAATVVRPLNLSYRSTAEVMALAREVLGPDLAPIEPLVARNGAPVELHEFGDIGEAVAFLGDALRGLVTRERTASVAVISRYPEQADVYYAGLMRSEVPALRRVRKQDFTFAPGVDVTDVSQVKGLEFDYVIMVEVNESSYGTSVEARHMVHIAATRAAHQLWLISTGEPSPLIPEWLRFGGVAVS